MAEAAPWLRALVEAGEISSSVTSGVALAKAASAARRRGERKWAVPSPHSAVIAQAASVGGFTNAVRPRRAKKKGLTDFAPPPTPPPGSDASQRGLEKATVSAAGHAIE